MIRLLLSLGLSSLLAPTLCGQKIEIQVDDLLRSPRLLGFEREDAPRPEWIHRQLRSGQEGSAIQGEGALLADAVRYPWFEADELLSVVRALGGKRGQPEIRGTTLLVDGTEAAATSRALTQLRRQLPPEIQLDVAVARVGESGTETLFRARESVRAGSTLTFADIENRRVIRDFDVEIAQSAAQANPVVGDLATGTCLALRPRILPGRDEVFLELFTRVATSAEAPPIDTTNLGMFAVDRAARGLAESGVVMRLPRGAKRTIEWTGSKGDRLRVTCSMSYADPKPMPDAAALVRCRGLFHKGVVEFRTDVPESDETPAPFAAQAAFERGGAEGVEVIAADRGATAAIVVTGAKAEQIDADVSTKLARSLRSAELEITVLDLPAGVDPGAAGDRGKTIAHIRSLAIHGKSVAFSGRTEMRWIRDWDVEVAQSARIGDPKVEVLRHGYHVDARILESSNGRPMAVALDAKVSRLDKIDVKKAKISSALRGGGTTTESGGKSPVVVLPEEIVPIESPVLRGQAISTVLRLDAQGTSTLRRAAPRLLGKGRELVVVVRVGK